MGLKTTLDLAHGILEAHGVPHALIGGMALSVWGVQRSTADIDFLVDEVDRGVAREALLGVGFAPFHETEEVLQFHGVGALDLLFARRPLARAMLADARAIPESTLRCVLPEDLIGLKIQAYKNAPKRELQDKADIQRLMETNPHLDLERVHMYADLFGEKREMERLWSIARAP